MTLPGAQPVFGMKSAEPVDEEPEEEACEPESPEAEKEKSVADRIRQARDGGRDPHTKNFLREFYEARANERAKRHA
jgi:hypothetical protein